MTPKNLPSPSNSAMGSPATTAEQQAQSPDTAMPVGAPAVAQEVVELQGFAVAQASAERPYQLERVLPATPRQAEAALNAGQRAGLLPGYEEVGVDKINLLRKDLVSILDASLEGRRSRPMCGYEHAGASLNKAIEMGWIGTSVLATPMSKKQAQGGMLAMLQAAEDATYLEQFAKVRGGGGWGQVVPDYLLRNQKLNPIIAEALEDFVKEIPGAVLTSTNSDSEQICGNYFGPRVYFRIGTDRYRIETKEPCGNLFDLTHWGKDSVPGQTLLDRVPLRRIARDFEVE